MQCEIDYVSAPIQQIGEPTGGRAVQRTAIIDFIIFEDSSSKIWPWAVSAEDMLQNETMLRELEKAVHFGAHGEFDTDELYDAIDRIAGVNPELASTQKEGAEMITPGM